MIGLTVKVALSGATYAFDKLYSYAVPPKMEGLKGQRVFVPFGRGNTPKQAMVFETVDAETYDLKTVLSVIDDKPVLSDEMLKMCEFMHETVFCTRYDAVASMLPTGLNHRLVNFYSANLDFLGLELLTDTEREIFTFLKAKGEKSEDEIISTFEVSSDLLKQMTEREVLIKNSETKQKVGDATQKWVRLTDDYQSQKLTPRQKEVVELNKPMEAVYIPKMIWKEMYDFSPDSVLLVLANTHYDGTEYIRDYKEYLKEMGVQEGEV